MTETCFELLIQDRVAHIKLNRPQKRNAMNPQFWDELPALVQDIDANSKARVIVISSTGPHFTAGIDITTFFNSSASQEGDDAEPLNNGARFYQLAKLMQNTFSSLENCRIPVLAAIQGGCIGGGVDFVTACDMRYACEDTFFTIEETNIGMTADVGTFPRLVKLIPEGIVRELSYTGAPLTANQAQAVGLVNRVYKDQETMLKEVMLIAKSIASKAPLAVHGCKRMINYSRDHSTADSLDYVATWNASMLKTQEIAEAMTAKLEKREPNFVELPKIPPSISNS